MLLNSRRMSSALALAVAVLLALVPASALAASPTSAPTLAGATTNSGPAPDISTRLYDAVGVLNSTGQATLSAKIADLWAHQNIDVLIAFRLKPGASTSDTENDAMNTGNNAKVGIGARGGLVVYYNLDDSKCHGQAQIYADDRLRAVVSNADRQSIYDNLMKPKLKDCDLVGATVVALDTVVAVMNGDRSALPGPIDWALIGLICIWIVIGLFALFILALVLGRFAAYPDARRRYKAMRGAYQNGKDDPSTPSDNDDDFIYGGGHRRRRNVLGHISNTYNRPDWDDPMTYPVYYGQPPGFWGWWFGVGAHTNNRVGGTASGGDWSGGARSYGGSWDSSGGRSSGGNWGTAGLAAGGFWSGIGHDASAIGGGVGEVLSGLADAAVSGSGGSGGFSGGGGAGGGF